MKYFTPELIVRLQEADAASVHAADAAWGDAEACYQRRLQHLGNAIAAVVEQFEGLRLHDALVLSINRQGDRLVVVVQQDIRPHDVVTITYTLAGEPFIDAEAIPADHRSLVMQFQYDELDVVELDGRTHFLHSILFSNGWEMRLPFRKVEVSFGRPVYTPTPWVPANVSAPATSPTA